jgi:V8-like Glu-specific endopeptidase
MTLSIRRPRAALILLALIALLASLALVAPGVARAQPASGDSGSVSTKALLSDDVRALVKGHGTGAEAEALAAYWTPKRMAAAKSFDEVGSPGGPQLNAGGSPAGAGTPATVAKPTGPAENPQATYPNLPPTHQIASTYGKVFFNALDNQGRLLDGQCSATVVNSPRKDMVWTAGHCVHAGGDPELTDDWFFNWTFVPAYKNNARPYGTWAATNLATRTRWIENRDFGEDVGVAVVAPLGGRDIVDVVGAQGIVINASRTYYAHSFGYPAAAPFNGEELYGCEGNTAYLGTTLIALVCDLTQGSSGGGWLRDVNGNGLGYLNGLNSHKKGAYPGYMFSPYYSEQVRQLYFFVVDEV